MRQRLASRRIDVGADVRLRQHVADRAVAERLGQRRRRQVDRRGGQPVQRVVGEGLGQVGIGVRAAVCTTAGKSI